MPAACSRQESDAKPSVEPVHTPKRKPGEPLSAGDELPAVSALAQTGARVSLDRSRGKPLLLFFCQSMRSDRCSALAELLNAHWRKLRAMNVDVVGVAHEYRARLRAVAYDSKLPFYVLADPHGRIFEAFGLKQEGAVFVVNAQGEIHKHLPEAPPKDLAERAVQLLAGLAKEEG